MVKEQGWERRSAPFHSHKIAEMDSSVNIGWPCSGMGDAEYLHAFQRIVMPIALEFSPDLVISELDK